MDVVVSYVNCDDPIWLESYQREIGGIPDTTRFRDWGTLKYLFRGVDKFMPFVDRIILIVSGDSQVPDFVNKETVKVVKHEDFIPHEYLPTFNANTIENFMPYIDGLSEKFIFFNDDFFVVKPCTEEDFFTDGKPNIFFTKRINQAEGFWSMCANTMNVANFAAFGAKSRFKEALVPQHTVAPFLRSKCLECLKNAEKIIRCTITKTREKINVTQYLFSDYLLFTNYYCNKQISFKMLRYGIMSMDEIVDGIEHPVSKTICFNEPNAPIENDGYADDKEKITSAFERLLPKKCRYEK